jgi:hypothetical protein
VPQPLLIKIPCATLTGKSFRITGNENPYQGISALENSESSLTIYTEPPIHQPEFLFVNVEGQSRKLS